MPCGGSLGGERQTQLNKSSKIKQRDKRTKREKGNIECTNEDVLKADIRGLLKGKYNITTASTDASVSNNEPQRQIPDRSDGLELPEQYTELDVKIITISSTGDGLGFSQDSRHVYVVPFSVPGDVVRAKVVKQFKQDNYSITDNLEVKTPGPDRDSSLIRCQYFAECSGCQLQMLSYDRQLAHKKSIIEKAYKNFSNLVPELIPSVLDTMPSPLQYGYRTKLSPHFDGPPNARRDKRQGIRPSFKEIPPIGFNIKGMRRVLDIEDCPLGTEAVREGLKAERERVKTEIDRFKLGATLLLRESTTRIQESASEPCGDAMKELKTCVTDNKNGICSEYVGNYIFENPANSFFQNNNSILPGFIEYVKELVMKPLTSNSDKSITHLIDAYCGSGLFTVCLSSLGLKSVGIDIAESSIKFATRNAQLNNIPIESATFKAADAAAIFADSKGPPDQTVVIIDPPRKGCDQSFLSQLLSFGPERVIYVSCNVHTQARDVTVLVEGITNANDRTKSIRYELKSLRGMDFFPQTGHVEGIALLDRL